MRERLKERERNRRSARLPGGLFNFPVVNDKSPAVCVKDRRFLPLSDKIPKIKDGDGHYDVVAVVEDDDEMLKMMVSGVLGRRWSGSDVVYRRRILTSTVVSSWWFFFSWLGSHVRLVPFRPSQR
ncbi:hypothetical protein Hanom_Chr14g01253951 [Helianthus anomalus]